MFVRLPVLAVLSLAAAAPQPRMVATGPVQVVWNQTRDACPGRNWAGHVGEQPDSMPLAWHNPLTNLTSLISANDWTGAPSPPLEQTCTPAEARLLAPGLYISELDCAMDVRESPVDAECSGLIQWNRYLSNTLRVSWWASKEQLLLLHYRCDRTLPSVM